MTKAVYIHIPFCEHICHYCDFNKVFIKDQPVNEYLHALQKEMAITLERFPTDTIKTIFVGGGTPTSLSLGQLNQLLTSIHRQYSQYMNGDLEFTFEANPSHLSREKLKLLFEAGVNRLSFGVQVFDNHLLEKIGRSHRVKDVLFTIDLAKQIGFENINLDLMYSLPGQTIDSFKDTLRQAFSLDVQHFSGYSLIIEPKTVFYNLMRKGKLNVPSEDIEADMYAILLDEMASHNYEQYEISNFAKKGFESTHNLTYWNNNEYYGMGAGAHSYLNGVRRTNAGPVNKYISAIEHSGFPYIEEHEVSKKEKMEEEMFLGLRKTKGISKQRFKWKFNEDLFAVFHNEISEQIAKGLLEEDGDYLKLSRRGMFLGNEVFQAFLID